MASTYSNLKIQLMATGENSGTWGNVTNVNLGTAIEEAIAGSADVSFSSANVTLTLTDTNASQTARSMRLNLTGTTGGARDLIVPAIEKMYVVNNGCADAVTVKVSGQTGIAVPAGKTMLVYNNGTDVVNGVTHLTSLTLGTPLAVAQGGTGSATGTFSGANITSLNASNISSGSLDNARTTASSSNGASTIVARDSSGNFAAATVNVTTLNSSGFVIDSIGNVRDIPQNSQTTGYTLVVGDLGKHISTNSSVTVPNAVFSTGDVVAVYNTTSSNVTVVQGGSVTLRKAGTATTGNATVLQYGVATILCTAANNFVISGALG